MFIKEAHLERFKVSRHGTHIVVRIGNNVYSTYFVNREKKYDILSI